jgi:hypothetical protein
LDGQAKRYARLYDEVTASTPASSELCSTTSW